MSIEDLKKTALFVAGDMEKREIELAGEKVEIYVKRLNAADMRQFSLEQMSNDIAVQSRAGFTAISKAICDGKGKAALTISDLESLKTEAYLALLTVVLDVNMPKYSEESGKL